MTDVGFPLDHNAILWCYGLLSSITHSMRVLSKLSADQSQASPIANYAGNPPVDINTIINFTQPVPSAFFRTQGELDQTVSFASSEAELRFRYWQKLQQVAIEPVAHFIERNASYEVWRNAEQAEIQYLLEVLSLPPSSQNTQRNILDFNYLLNSNPVRVILAKLNLLSLNLDFSGNYGQNTFLASLSVSAFLFLNGSLSLILLMYTLTSVLILSVPLIKSLGGFYSKHSKTSMPTYWELMHPFAHLYIDLIAPVLYRTLKALLGFVISEQTFDRLVSVISIGQFVLPLAVVVTIGGSQPLRFLAVISPVLQVIHAYGIALAIRVGLFAVFFTIKKIVGTIYFALRLTIWRKPVRSLIAKIGGVYPFSVLCRERTWLLGALIFLIVGSFDKYSSGDLYWGYYFLSVTILFEALIIVYLMIQTTLSIPPPVLTTKSSDLRNINGYLFNDMSILLTIWMVPLLMYPSVNFAFELIVGDFSSHLLALPLYGLFGPELIHFSLALFGVIYFILAMRNPSK